MMSMRLTRIGSKNRPSYRIVVMDSKKARESRAKEYLGMYNPTTEPPEFKIDLAKASAELAVMAAQIAALRKFRLKK